VERANPAAKVCSFQMRSNVGRPRFFLPLRCSGDLLHGFTESVQARVDIFPGNMQRLRIERPNQATHFFQFQHSRAFRDEQTNTS